MSVANPVEDYLKVMIQSTSNEKVIFVLSDMSGRQLKNETRQINTGSSVIDLFSLSNAANGVYILSIKTDSQHQSIKIIKGGHK